MGTLVGKSDTQKHVAGVKAGGGAGRAGCGTDACVIKVKQHRFALNACKDKAAVAGETLRGVAGQRTLGDIFQNALFIGMIAAFLGFVFCDFSRLWNPEEGYSATSGLIPVCVMGVSAVVMVLCGLAMRIPKLKWLNDYALPISLIAGMAAAIPITAWLG